MSIAERIKEVIEANGLTIDQFAEKIGDKPQRVKDVLRGKQRVPGDMLVSLVEIFHVDANWLLTGVRTAPAQPASEAAELSQREKVILEKFRMLDPKGQDEIEEAVQKVEQIKTLERRVAELEKKAG